MSSNRRSIHQQEAKLPHAPRLTGHVLQKHIDGARKKNSSHCMTAAGLAEEYKHLTRWSVDIQTIRASDMKKGLRYIWLTPRSVQTNIINWDHGTDVRPFNFKLDGGHVILVNRW